MIMDIESMYKSHFMPENYNCLINKDTLKILTSDKTSQSQIIFATNDYQELGCDFTDPITVDFLKENPAAIIPRIFKSKEIQKERTSKKAEVFTPAWIVNKQNNLIDNSWFGSGIKNGSVFNLETEGNIVYPKWLSRKTMIPLEEYNKSAKEYITSTRLEITCGEAPYLVSRYDASTGQYIPVSERVGMLDRKLRIVNENFNTEESWLQAADFACQSCYGYEYQGDSLLLARLNILYTVADNFEYKFNKPLGDKNILDIILICNTISYNLFQMDGLTDCIPTNKGGFDLKWLGGKDKKEKLKNRHKKKVWIESNGLIPVKIMDWQTREFDEFRKSKTDWDWN